MFFALGQEFWSQSSPFLRTLARSIGGFARESRVAKAKWGGNLTDVCMGGMGFDGEHQIKMCFPWNLIVKYEAANKGGARWRRKGKADQ